MSPAEREELRRISYDLAKIAERRKLGRLGRHDAEREPELKQRLRELTPPQAPQPPPDTRFTPMRYRDPERT